MSDDQLEQAFDAFADATEASLTRFAATVAELRSEIATFRTEQRSAPTLTQELSDAIIARVSDSVFTRVVEKIPTPVRGEKGADAVVDVDSIIARVTDSVILRVIEKIPAPTPGEKGERGEPGQSGKDAIVNTEEIVARVAELAVPRIAAVIPTPAKGDKGEPGQNGKDGERGEDGLSSPEEIRAIAREEVLTQQRSFYKGVYRDSTPYRTADATTWDGSMWFATRDTISKPGTDDSWLLAVKRGRDARK